jgi:L-alanine-DL-glutamate epimerase-like enolase superfamily enzyme
MDGFEAFTHLFLGQNPLSIARHVRTLETISFHAGRYWPFEAALWDIVGQVCVQPVATLFGGYTDRLPAYASCGELKPPDERAESALALRERGFRALKIRIQPNALAQGLATVGAVRQAVGDSMDILVDLNQGWRMPGDIASGLDMAAVRHLAEELRDLGVLWLEEPLPAFDVRGLAALRAATGMRIAGGEMARTLDELLGYLEADALDVYQPDVVLAVGMSRARLVAELAHARNRWFTPHTWTNGLGLLANLHVAAGVGAGPSRAVSATLRGQPASGPQRADEAQRDTQRVPGPYIEFPYDPPGWTVERRDFFLAEPVQIQPDGCVAVPCRPGLGAILDENTMKRYELT